MRTWIAVVLLAACSHGAGAPKSTQPTPLASGASCDQMSTHVVQVMPGGADGSSGEAGKKVAAILQERCATDGWSSQARQCLFDVKDLREADSCKQYLTKVQIDAADKQMDAALPPSQGASDKSEPQVVEAPPPAKAPPASTRAPTKKKQESAKKSGDPCMGGE